jgi:hypothetical protein
MNKETQEGYDNFQTERTIGEITISLPKPPDITKIDNHNLLPFKQKFQYNTTLKRDEEPTDNFLNTEVQKFKNGYWFFCGGNLEYISNIHYIMLNYSIIDGKRPLFTDAQRDFFLVWSHCELDEYCFGLCLTTIRRFGKGEIAIIIALARTILNTFHHCGIQSKTNDDAKQFFLKLVQRWQRFPDFLKPIDEGITNPKSEIRFFEPSSRAINVKKVSKEAINSWIDYKGSVSSGYDGSKLHTYIMDEAAKNPKECDPYDTWNIVKYCLLDGSEIIGKALITTTVESTESVQASESYKEMWDDSDPNDRLGNGMTKTGLYRYYIPGYMGYYGVDKETGFTFIDEYGYSRQELTKGYILKNREGLEGNALSSQIRKISMTVEEAFMADGDKCFFNSHNLENQKTWLKEFAHKGLVRRVTLYRNEQGIVTMKDDPRGKFQIIWDFLNSSDSNKSKNIGNRKHPANTEFGSVGVDPYSFTETVGGKSSMGVAYAIRKGDPLDPENSGLPIMRYADRPPRKSIFHDNVCMMGEYYGIKINYEGDVNDFIEVYEGMDKQGYLMNTPKAAIDPSKSQAYRLNKLRQKGTLSKDVFALQKHFDTVHLYVEVSCHKIYFVELIDNLLKYDHYKRTKSDDTVAFGMGLLGTLENMVAIPNKPKKILITKHSKKYH